MNDSSTTLSSFFHVESLPKTQFSKIEPSENIAAIKQRAIAKAIQNGWPLIFDEVFKQIEKLFGIEVPEIIKKAWNEGAALLKYLDKEKYPPDETILVTLVEHTIKSTHKPYLEILINDAPIGKIEFEVEIALTLKGTILKIQDSTIKGIYIGSCKGEGVVKCEGIQIMKRETSEFSLPRSIDFKDGLRIG